jgi:subtilisin family serine protease
MVNSIAAMASRWLDSLLFAGFWYPFGTYATSSGTSFSAPLVSGTASLLVQLTAGANQSQAAAAFSNEVYIGPDLGNGRLDIYQALAAR